MTTAIASAIFVLAVPLALIILAFFVAERFGDEDNDNY